MKMQVICQKCFFDYQKLEVRDVEMNNDGLFEFTCSNGHDNITRLQIEKFEALFDIGVDALINGYKIEAIGSFSTSLERFYEWFIRVVCLKNEIEPESFNVAWKPMRNNSQQQIGAFLIMYLREFNEDAPAIDSKQTGLRNRVLHKGYIPTYEEVYEYGNYVLNYINEVLERMGSNYRQYYQINFHNQNEILFDKYSDIQSTTLAVPTVIGLNSNQNIDTMDKAIKLLEERNRTNESMRNIPTNLFSLLGLPGGDKKNSPN